MKKVYLGSESAMKREPLRKYLDTQEDKFELHTVNVASEVNEQPFRLVEMLRGAFNRITNILKYYEDGDVYFAIENGLRWEVSTKKWLDYALCMRYNNRLGVFEYSLSKAVEFPQEAVIRTLLKEGGFSRNTVGRTLQEMGLVKDHADPHLDLAGISRKDLIYETLVKLGR